MPKTFLWKFTFFFWVGFFLVNIPIYFFGVSYIKEILKTSEKEKVTLMLHTLKPIVAISISFNQNDQLYNIFENLLQYDYIDSIDLNYSDGKNIHIHSHKEHVKHEIDKMFTHKTSILDPFTNKKVATITLRYFNTYLDHLNEKVLSIFLFLFILATFIYFMLFVFLIRKDIEALQLIENKLNSYLSLKTFSPIEIKNRSQEITTIVDVINNVIKENFKYVNDLQIFNTELESKVDEKVKELKEKDELMVHQSRQAAMGEMLESIAHQWRQPLNVIGLASSKIDLGHKLKTLDDATFNDSMETIYFNINYMSNTIDDFRSFIHPNQEKMNFSPKKSFEEVVKILGAQLQHNHIKYEISAEQDIQIYGIKNEFQQAIVIMINNSIDAIKSQIDKSIKREYKISIDISKESNYVVIHLKDNGGGIKEDIIHSIFTAYFTTKFASQGTGIGLYIVQGIIQDRMHGTVEVENVIDGCCFTIKLPFSAENEGLM